MHAPVGIRDLAATGLATLLLAAGLTVGIGAASAGPSDGPGSNTTPAEPHDDPFYTPPAGFESSAPGTVLASRPVTVTGLGLPVPADSHQFLVRSTDAKGAPTTAVGTLMVPRSPYGAGIWRVAESSRLPVGIADPPGTQTRKRTPACTPKDPVLTTLAVGQLRRWRHGIRLRP